MVMNLRTYAEIGLIALAAVLAFLFTNASRDRAKAEGAAAVYAEQLDAALDWLAQSKSAQLAKDSAAARINAEANAEIAAANARRIQAEQRSDAAAARRPEVIERVIRAAGIDSAVVRVAVETVADSIVQNEVQPLRVALAQAALTIGAKDVQIAARDAQLAARDRVNENLTVALAASRGEAGALRDALPGWFGRNAPKVLVPAAFVVGWILNDQLSQ